MFEKLAKMKLKQRLNFGYKVVIILMVVSAILSAGSMAILYSKLD